MIRQKKAQVTWFIILGIILVLAIAVVLFIQQQNTKIDPAERIDIPYRQTPIYTYTEECIEKSTAKGLDIMGVQGGYIDIPAGRPTLEAYDPEGRHVVSEDRIKAVEKKDSANSIPYWITRNFADIPSLEDLEEGLEEFIEQDTLACIDGFKAFKEQGYEIEYGDIEADVSFGKDTNVDVMFPITAKKQETIDIERFVIRAPVNFRLLYETAYSIAEEEFTFGFIEESTNNLISLYSGVDEKKLPPTAATITNLDCDYKTWDEEDTRNLMKAVLDKGISYIKVAGTEFIQPKKGILESFVFDTGLAGSGGLKAEFDYDPGWDLLEFDIKPGEGPGIANPDRIAATNVPMVPQICSFEYNYKYDLEYPVLLTISDQNSKKISPTGAYQGGGYSLNVPLWIFICGNQVRECTGKPAYLDNLVLNQTFAKEAGYVDTLFCDEKQRISKTIDIKVSSENSPLEGVDVHYYCGEESNNNCYIGSTGNDGTISARFPLCVNGRIRLWKKGYAEKLEILTTTGDEKDLAYDLEKKKTLNSDVRIIRLSDFIRAYKSGTPVSGYASPVNEKEKVILSLEGAGSLSRMYPGVETNISISSGEYLLEYMIRSETKILPSFLEGNREISYNQEGGVYDGKWITGSGEYAFMLSESDLHEKENMVFTVIARKRGGEYAAVDEFRDRIFDEQGNIDAELLYEEGELVAVDGLLSKDFEAEEGQKVEYITIKKEEVSRYLRPVLR